MHLIVGLGNPGEEYVGTRHNIGFNVVDAIAAKLRIRFRSKRGLYSLASGTIRNESVLLLKPLTYMNNSGSAVRELIDLHKIPLSAVQIIVDDFQIPLGKVRLRLKGSDGGHNGLHSIIYQLHTSEFPRIRCGIGSEAMPTEKSQMADFVLTQFEPSESKLAKEMIGLARDAAMAAVIDGFAAAMNQIN